MTYTWYLNAIGRSSLRKGRREMLIVSILGLWALVGTSRAQPLIPGFLCAQFGNHNAFLITRDGTAAFWGNFGSLPGSWNVLTPLPSSSPIVAVGTFDAFQVVAVTEENKFFWGRFGSTPGTWQPLTPEIPTQERVVGLADLGGHSLLAITESGMAFYGAFGNLPGTWTVVAEVPITVPITGSTWSNVKRGFR